MKDARLDDFLDGRLRLRQSAAGHRAGTDAVLLAAATPEDQEGFILDVGAGAGAVGLMAALRAPRATIGLVEIDPESCAFARENIAANALDARATVYEADALAAKSRRAAGLIDEKAALVLTNPPFHDAGKVRVTPDAAKARAHVASAPLVDWMRACLALLAPGGSFVMIHRADALAECLAAVEGRLGGVSIQPIHTRAEASATRILLAGVKGSKAPLSILKAIVT
ncbi:tRNA1(Val) (adenine(37)-N6)-methyltransferase [Methylocystis sp. SC2]|uniref:tRNA1(Val) (adenine(37)-N6)-methyltransferase n=1 Tax=Methylocystis sp. (strain SC2) TaxID=187303 RepID=UPI0005A53628|nr:methyltransferase [Methylocystis sp. SC2]